jgi:hypothetical protein
VHEGATVDDAYAVYVDEKAASGAAGAASGAGLADDRKI